MFAALALLATELCESFLKNPGPFFFEDRLGPVEAGAKKKAVNDVANIFPVRPQVLGVFFTTRFDRAEIPSRRRLEQ